MNSTVVNLLAASVLTSLFASGLFWMSLVKGMGKGKFTIFLFLALFAVVPYVGSMRELGIPEDPMTSILGFVVYTFAAIPLLANFVTVLAYAYPEEVEQVNAQLVEVQLELGPYHEPVLWAIDNKDPPRRQQG